MGAGGPKETWGPGPWQAEPDALEWMDGNLPCQVMRSMATGALCGYVGLPAGHPWHGVQFLDVPADAHGGLTFSRADADGLWWVGFDCAHAGDYCPALAAYGWDGTYRTLAFARAEVGRLVTQARRAALRAVN